MNRKRRQVNDIAELDELIEEITLDAYGGDEQLSAFWQAFEDEVSLPTAGFVKVPSTPSHARLPLW